MADRGGLSAHTLFSLVRRNLALIVGGTLLGAITGFALATINPTYGATVVVEVATGVDPAQTSTLVESAASTIESPAIISKAATTLGVPDAQLSQSVSADVQPGTNLINLSATADSADSAVEAATEVTNVAITDYRTRSDERAKQVRSAGADLLADGTLDAARAESARQASIGSVVGTAQGQAIQDTVTLSVASPALSAYREGVSRPVGIILGAAAGALLTALVALSQAWNRRRPIRTLDDLEYAGDISGAPADPADRAAGLALSSGRKVVLVLGADEAGREALARRAAEGMVLNGTHTALVVVVPGEEDLHEVGADRWEIGAGQVDEVLSRVQRRRLPERLGTDAVVLCAPLTDDVTLYLAGQDDYLALLAIPVGTQVGRAAEQLEKVATADPIGVLQA